MANRFLIGKGELLAYDIPPPKMKADKVHPYTLRQALEFVVPQLTKAALEFQALPEEACPGDIAVAKLDLHPAYISKSFFPTKLFRDAGLVHIGSRTVRVRPRIELRKTAGIESDTTQLFVAGSREAFGRLPSFAMSLSDGSTAAEQFAEIESFAGMKAADRIVPSKTEGRRVFEIGLHAWPEHSIEQLRRSFTTYAKKHGFKVNSELLFPVGRMLFVAAEGESSQLDELANYSLVRAVRPMPKLRGSRPLNRADSVSIGFRLPPSQPLSTEPRVAILDGGLPARHALGAFVENYKKSDPDADDVATYLNHGLGVTSAFLFGPLEPGQEAARPYAPVDHFRVMDKNSDDDEDEFDLYRTLAHVEEVLLSREYSFINLSVGPNSPTDDRDVHAWTAVLDTLLSDGETFMTVAAGNNGERSAVNQFNRILSPSDSVNALTVGASDTTKAGWKRAPYSAVGPGRSPGIRKPDVVQFGGSPGEYFHLAGSGSRPTLVPDMGTSYAAPYVLRTAVGVRAVLGDAVHPLTIKALLINAAGNPDALPAEEVGWGKVPSDLNEIILCNDGVARILYQGTLRPGKYLRAPLPLPKTALIGMVKLTATFCYATAVDVEDAAAYTKAGLSIKFRPNSEREQDEKSKAQNAAAKPFFPRSTFRTEQEQRADLGKWETVLHASKNMRGSGLKDATFDIHYNARDGGGQAPAGTEKIRYALVLTIEAPKHADLYDQILRAHSVLKAIEPKVSLPIRV